MIYMPLNRIFDRFKFLHINEGRLIWHCFGKFQGKILSSLFTNNRRLDCILYLHLPFIIFEDFGLILLHFREDVLTWKCYQIYLFAHTSVSDIPQVFGATRCLWASPAGRFSAWSKFVIMQRMLLGSNSQFCVVLSCFSCACTST